MGTDTVGKQEIDAQKLIHENDITAIGNVINGTHPGRSNDDEVTVSMAPELDFRIWRQHLPHCALQLNKARQLRSNFKSAARISGQV